MVWLRNSKKFEDTPVCLLVSTEYANVTDRRTDGQNRMTAQAALMHNTSRQKMAKLLWDNVLNAFNANPTDWWTDGWMNDLNYRKCSPLNPFRVLLAMTA